MSDQKPKMPQPELEDYLEMLMRYTQRYDIHMGSGYYITFWAKFKLEYPYAADDMEKWLEGRHKEA